MTPLGCSLVSALMRTPLTAKYKVVGAMHSPRILTEFAKIYHT